MKSISSRMLLWIGGTAVMLFVAGLLVTQQVQGGMYETAIEAKKEDARDMLHARIQEKLMSGLGAAVAIASNPDLSMAVFDRDHEGLAVILKRISKEYADRTEYKNIQFLVIDGEGNFLLRTYAKEPDSGRGKDATYRVGVKDLLESKKPAHVGVDLSSGGLVLSSMTSVNMYGRNVGVLEFRSGFGSINDEMLANNYYHLAVLNDKAVERFKKGKEHKKFGSYYVAHEEQFRDKTQAWYADLPMDEVIARGSWDDGTRVVIVEPVQEGDGAVIGYHLLGFDRSILAGRFAELDRVAHVLEGVMLLMVLGIMLVVWLAVRRQVSQPVALMQAQLAAVARNGRFDQPIVLAREDEMGRMAQAVNGLLAMLSQSLGGVNHVLSQVAQGDFRQRIEADLPGDMGVMKDSVNTAVSALQANMVALSHAMDALGNGRFDYRMEPSVEPKMRAQVDGAMQTLQTTISQINACMQAVVAGDFSQELSLEARGELAVLKDSINGSIQSLRTAMSELGAAADAMAHGDLTVQVQGQYQGELMRIATAFNAGVRSVHDSLRDIAGAAGMVVQAAGEVATGNNDLSSRTQTQAASLERTSSAMEQMTAAILQTADNAQQARALAENTQQAAGSGVALMDQTVQAMREIGEANERITSIVSLIDSIAFQTNLLALNAAVEAARAGEHGRGFAVVAGEVRSLAQKAADAARDIKSLIGQTVGKIEAGDQLVAQTVAAFADIQTRLTDTDKAIGAIAQAMGEQRSGVEQVNRSVAELDESTQQNAALVEETSAAAETMRGQAQEVQERIARFKLAGGVSAPAPAPVRAVPGKSVQSLPAPVTEEWQTF